MSLLTEVET
ncbi:matrix protein 2, partial [Influenza A virus (A/Hong Kong/485/1997(H5N1))]